MTLSPLRLACLSVFASLSALAAIPDAAAQQITYYDFNVPASAQAPYASCAPSTTTPLVCLNNNPALSNSSGPSYGTATYPTAIDPTANGSTDSPPYQAVQLTQAAGTQGGSLWFAVPQKVANGFTAYFTFQITPSRSSGNTADGIAFVIQNAHGGQSSGQRGAGTYCAENNANVTVTGADGGCIGYGGIDNSVAFEFDTYANSWDPFALGAGNNNDNHIAIMSCGTAANSPDHTGPCQVTLNAGTNLAQQALVNNPNNVTLADGNIHQVVITYNGPNEANPNLLQIFIDPVFNPGTHTPMTGSTPALSGVYNLTANLNLINSATGNSPPSPDSAYVGFTSSTGADFETHTLLNWTYTPHTPVTQTQPIAQNGQTTVFPFGAHTYGVTYPADIPTSGISMTVTANPISQTLFSQLINAGPFAGSQCQLYDETGGNCIVYTVSCDYTASGTPTACPAATAADPIIIKSAYNDSIPATKPGFLQGDPFYSPLATISGNGTTATVNCTGECAVTAGQVVTIAAAQSGGNPSPFNGTVTVLSVPATNQFTFASPVSSSATGGYLTSTNLQNIFYQQLPYRLDATTTGKTKNFSDFVVTAVTVAPVATVSPSSLDFGTLYLGSLRIRTVTLTNTGNAPMTVSTPFIQNVGNGDSKEFVALSLCPKTLAAGKSCNIYVTFLAGPAYTPQTATLKVTDSAPGSPQLVPLTATVINPRGTFSPSPVFFGYDKVGSAPLTSSVVLKNAGATPLTITGMTLLGANPADFSFTSTCPSTLAGGTSCTIPLTFTPGANNRRTALLVVTDNAAGGTQQVELIGNSSQGNTRNE